MIEIDIGGQGLRLTKAHYDRFTKRLSRRALVKFYRSLISGTESTLALSEKYGLSHERVCQLYNNYVQPLTGHDVWWRRRNVVRPPRIGKIPPVVAEVVGQCRKWRLTCEPIKLKNQPGYRRAAILIESYLCVIGVTNKPYKIQYAGGKRPQYWYLNSYRDADFHLFKTPDGWYVIDRVTISKHSACFFIPIAGIKSRRGGPVPKTDWRKHYEAWRIIKKEANGEEKRLESHRDADNGAPDGGSPNEADAVEPGEIRAVGRAGTPA